MMTIMNKIFERTLPKEKVKVTTNKFYEKILIILFVVVAVECNSIRKYTSYYHNDNGENL